MLLEADGLLEKASLKLSGGGIWAWHQQGAHWKRQAGAPSRTFPFLLPTAGLLGFVRVMLGGACCLAEARARDGEKAWTASEMGGQSWWKEGGRRHGGDFRAEARQSKQTHSRVCSQLALAKRAEAASGEWQPSPREPGLEGTSQPACGRPMQREDETRQTKMEWQQAGKDNETDCGPATKAAALQYSTVELRWSHMHMAS